MTTDELLKIVTERGLRIEIKNGQPVLVRKQGDKSVTDRLLAVLKRHREAIIERLTPKPAQGTLGFKA